MPTKHRGPSPAEFRLRTVKLMLAGRTPEDLANDFEPTAQAIARWAPPEG